MTTKTTKTTKTATSTKSTTKKSAPPRLVRDQISLYDSDSVKDLIDRLPEGVDYSKIKFDADDFLFFWYRPENEQERTARLSRERKAREHDKREREVTRNRREQSERKQLKKLIAKYGTPKTPSPSKETW
jgi:hypothetical protein